MTCWVRREPILAGCLTATDRSNFPKQRSNKQASPVGWLRQGGPGAAFRDGERGGYWRGEFEVNHGVGGGRERLLIPVDCGLHFPPPNGTGAVLWELQRKRELAGYVKHLGSVHVYICKKGQCPIRPH